MQNDNNEKSAIESGGRSTSSLNESLHEHGGARVIAPLPGGVVDDPPPPTPPGRPKPPEPQISTSQSVPPVTITSSTDVPDQTDSIYPTATSGIGGTSALSASGMQQQYITGSQLAQEKPRVPIGIYVVAGWNILSFVGDFFNAQNSAITDVVMLVNLLLGIGLLFRLEVARKFIIWIAGIVAILSIVNILALYGLQQRVQHIKNNYETAVSNINKQTLTLQQKQQLEEQQNQIDNLQKQEGKAVKFAYIEQSVIAIAGVLTVVYLTRPKVKEAFHDLPK